jgi:Flp pilus assembly protein TadG
MDGSYPAPATPARRRFGAATALLRCRRGSPAMEFVLVAPVMIILLTGSYDITQLLIARSEVISAAQEIVEIATELSVQPDQSISLTTNQAYQAQTAIFALMPGLKSGAGTNPFAVTLSAVVFTATPAGCVAGGNPTAVPPVPACIYVANTAWSNALPQSTPSVTRACGVVAQVTPTQPTSIANLPTAGMTALTSLVVADVSYTYWPLFSGFMTGPVVLQRTAFLPPRSGAPTAYVEYDLTNAATDPSICPGYL